MTQVLDFFKFIYKRQLIWHKRFILKEKFPWSNDYTLKTFKFINMYRELDKCTIYILNKLNGKNNRKTIFYNILFYRFFNKENLYEKLYIDIFENLNSTLANKIIENLSKIKNSGTPIFNDAYLIASNKTDEPKHIYLINMLKNLNQEINDIISKIDASKTPRESLNIIQKIPSVGPFLACEIWTDLSYFNFFKQGWNDNDFVNIGPGAKWGLEILFSTSQTQKVSEVYESKDSYDAKNSQGELLSTLGIVSKKNSLKLTKKELEEKLNYLYKKQKEILPTIHKELGEKLEWKDIAYKKAFSNYPYLSITNIEGALCEFRKYTNLNKKNEKHKKRYFKESSYLNKFDF